MASTSLPRPRASAPMGRVRALWQHGDGAFRIVLVVASLLVLLLVVGIGWALWQNSELSRQAFGFTFLWNSTWDPVKEIFAAFPFLYGTLITSFLALLFAVPLGLGAAIFLAELAPTWIRIPAGTLVELLAAVPSVVFGVWGLYVFVPVVVKPLGIALNDSLGFLPIFAGPVFGPSRLAAGLLLAIMVLPTITAISRDVFRAIPNAQREGSLALGATRWETVRRVLIPYGRSGIFGAIVLGLSRALGETIAVTMVIGNNLDLTPSLLHPGYTMASVIANEFTEATSPLYVSALIEIGLVLFVLTLIVNAIAQLLIHRVGATLHA
ncbi:MAG: phosphate ABC transporter permease subunit PstC [Candidatus Limnocylindrales bacterium]